MPSLASLAAAAAFGLFASSADAAALRAPAAVTMMNVSRTRTQSASTFAFATKALALTTSAQARMPHDSERAKWSSSARAHEERSLTRRELTGASPPPPLSHRPQVSVYTDDKCTTLTKVQTFELDKCQHYTIATCSGKNATLAWYDDNDKKVRRTQRLRRWAHRDAAAASARRAAADAVLARALRSTAAHSARAL